MSTASDVSIPAERFREIASLLRSQEGDLLESWKATAQTQPESSRLPEQALVDHVPLLLSRLVAAIEDMAEAAPEQHVSHPAEEYALSRLAESVDLVKCIREIDALKLLVMDLWSESFGPRVDTREVRALQLAFNALTREIVDSYAKAERRLSSALDRIASVMLEAPIPLHELLRRLLAVIVDSVSAVDTASVFLMEADRLVLRAVVGLREQEVDVFSLRVGEGFAGRVAQAREACTLPSAATADEVRSSALRSHGVRALYGVPLLYGDRLLGVVTAGSLTEYTLSKLATRLLHILAARASAVIAVGLYYSDRERLTRDLTVAATVAQRRAAELDATIDAIMDGVVVYDKDGAIVRTNAAAEALSGYAPGEVATPIEDCIRTVDALDESGHPLPVSAFPVSRALRGEAVRGISMQVRPKNAARHLYMVASAAPIRGVTGEPIGAVATFADVTRLHDLQQRQQDMMRMISHDLRTPLGIASMQADLLLKKAQRGTAEVVARGKRIRRSLTAMNTIIEDLVDVARLESGQIALHPRAVDLRQWLSDLLARFEGVLDVGRVRAQVADNVRPVRADPDRLERVLTNLLSNALKYSPGGSPVTIEATGTNGEIAISVSDEGVGIQKDDLPHIFDRFYRASRTKNAEGIGLGLYITRLLVEAHGGRIEVTSEPAHGSRFTVFLPSAS